MIGKLKGLIDSIGEGELILDVNGVGYVVAASARTLRNLPGLGEAAAPCMSKRKCAKIRSGCSAFSQRENATGSACCRASKASARKWRWAILGALSAADLANAIALQDKAAVAQAQGVGPKLAARIVAELKDKAPALGAADLGLPAATRAAPELGGPAHDAVLALVNLGYARPQATQAVAKGLSSLGVAATTAALIRHSLKELAQ